MANVKITQLPLATTPLTGTEVFPLVQGTTTKQVAITGLFTSPVMTNPTLGTVGQADLINATGLPISTGVAGLGTGVATFLGTPSSANLRAAVTDETGSGALVFANAPVLVAPDLGTPSVLVATNATGTAVGLTAGSAITNANLTGAVTSVGNATSLGSFTSAQLRTALTDETGAGSAVFATSPTITAPILNQINDTNNAQILGLSPTTSAVDYLVVKNGIGVGVPLHFYADGSSANIGLHIQPKGTGLVTISDGTDFNKGIRFRSSSSAASAITLLDAVSTAGRVVTLPDATTTLVGRDTTDTLTNKTIAFASNTFTGTLGTTNGGTGLSSFTSGGVVYASSTSALATGSSLVFNGTNLAVGTTISGTRRVNILSGAGIAPLVAIGPAGYLLVDNSGAGENYYQANSAHIWQGLSGGEHMRLSSATGGVGALGIGYTVLTSVGNNGLAVLGNVGIGTSSPAYKLDVYGTVSLGSPTVSGSARQHFVRTGGAITADTTNGLTFKPGSGSVTDQFVRFENGGATLIGAFGNVGDRLSIWTRDTSNALNITQAGNLGIGTSSPASILHVKRTTGSSTITIDYNGTNIGRAEANANGNLYFGLTTGSGSVSIGTTSVVDAIYVASAGNVGIGTSSPNSKFESYSSTASSGTPVVVATLTSYSGVANGNGAALLFRSQSNAGVYSAAQISSRLTDGTSGGEKASLSFSTVRAGTLTEAMTLDNAGNLGLGVTPSAWNTFTASFQIAGTSLSGLGANNAVLASNAYYNTGWKYYGTDTASRYQQQSGQHQWYTAASGTAGNAITFTQAMTLDASGNLGVGTTSPATYGKFVVQSSSNAIIARSGNTSFCEINVQSGTSDEIKGQFQAILGSSNKVIIGSRTNHPLAFNIFDTEIARFDTSGNLLVGVTSAFSSGKVCIQVANGATQNGITIQDNASSGFNYIGFSNGSGSTIASISRVGTTNAVAYNTTSDYRLKTVHGALTGYGERIDALKPIRYEWKDGAIQDRGFLAHEFQIVYPNSVTGDKDAVDADGNPIYQAMQASTSEVIADLVAEIQSLRKRLADAGI